MKAYAILDGGGVKGAALVGCLKAAEELGIEFVGYGGTSAGSIIALLASVGYTVAELEGNVPADGLDDQRISKVATFEDC
jgi:NTE family protein